MSPSEPSQPIPVAVTHAEPTPGGPAPAGGRPIPEPVIQTPPIDIHEGPDGLVLEADLPGTCQERIEVNLEDHVLHLRAAADRPLPEGALPIHEEYPRGVFQRSFILSDEVDRARITAEYKNGVLRLFLPRAERARTRRIEIRNQES